MVSTGLDNQARVLGSGCLEEGTVVQLARCEPTKSELKTSNMRIPLIYLSLALCMGMAVGCSSVGKMPPEVDSQVKAMQPPAGKALVYVVRPTLLGKPFGGTITANGTYVGTTRGGVFVYALLTPGEYKFKVTGHDNADAMATNLEADKTYFIKEEVFPGFFSGFTKLVLLDNDSGRKALQKCSLGNKLGENIAH